MAPGSRLNLLVSTRTFLPLVGGAELGIHEIYKRIATEHDVTVLTRPHPPGVLRESGESEARPADYRVVHVLQSADRLPWQLSHYPRLLGASFAAAIRRLHARRPVDALNAHFVRPHLMPLRVAKRLGIRTVLSLVGTEDVLGNLPAWKQAYMRSTCAGADLVVANSALYLAGGRIGADIRTIPYGVDLDRFRITISRREARDLLGIPRDAFVLLTVHRLASPKRIDLIIKALRLAKEQIPAARLIVVGSGPEERLLRDLAAQLGVDDSVWFAGQVTEDLPLYYRAADCLVSHSMAETFGIVFAEAMVVGLPIIAARTSSEVPPGEAVLFEPFDLDELVTALLSHERDPASAEKRTVRNKLYAQRHFDWDAIAEEYLRALSGK